MVKNGFFWNNSKNIDISILRKEQNLSRSEFYMRVQSLVKIDWEMPVKNSRWPPRKLVFMSFHHQTAVISRASSWSPCFFLFLKFYTFSDDFRYLKYGFRKFIFICNFLKKVFSKSTINSHKDILSRYFW